MQAKCRPTSRTCVHGSALSNVFPVPFSVTKPISASCQRSLNSLLLAANSTPSCSWISGPRSSPAASHHLPQAISHRSQAKGLPQIKPVLFLRAGCRQSVRMNADHPYLVAPRQSRCPWCWHLLPPVGGKQWSRARSRASAAGGRNDKCETGHPCRGMVRWTPIWPPSSLPTPNWVTASLRRWFRQNARPRRSGAVMDEVSDIACGAISRAQRGRGRVGRRWRVREWCVQVQLLGHQCCSDYRSSTSLGPPCQRCRR